MNGLQILKVFTWGNSFVSGNLIDRHIPEFRDTYNSLRSLSFGMNLTQFCAKPRKLYSSKWSFSVHARTIASTLSLETYVFLKKKCVHIYYMVLAPVWHFGYFSVKPLSSGFVITLSNLSSHSFSVLKLRIQWCSINTVCICTMFENLP